MKAIYRTRESAQAELTDIPDPLTAVAKSILSSAEDILGKVTLAKLTKVLHIAIDGQTSQAGRTRAMLQLHLARVAAMEALAPGVVRADADEMISTTEAASILGCSRPHVAMLIDGGKLPGSTKSEGGHRQAPMSAVLALKIQREVAAERAAASASDYRAAGKAAGIYNIPEEAWMGTAKRGR